MDCSAVVVILSYKLVGQEPKFRILPPAREVEELLHHQFVHQTLNQCGLSAPVIHRVSGDKWSSVVFLQSWMILISPG